MPGDPTVTDPKLGTAAREADETRPIAKTAAAKTAKPHRRGFRKGADLDEEMWPAESFGGVSDEQFWDDLASDKPLATTARTAQQEPPSRNRLSGPAPGAGLITGPAAVPAASPAAGLDTGPATDPQAAPRTAPAQPRRRRPGGAEEAPRPSSAFPRRRGGPVAGRSARRARNGSADRYDTGTSPYPAPSYSDTSAATQMMSTPPYGQN